VKTWPVFEIGHGHVNITGNFASCGVYSGIVIAFIGWCTASCTSNLEEFYLQVKTVP